MINSKVPTPCCSIHCKAPIPSEYRKCSGDRAMPPAGQTGPGGDSYRAEGDGAAAGTGGTPLSPELARTAPSGSSAHGTRLWLTHPRLSISVLSTVRLSTALNHCSSWILVWGFDFDMKYDYFAKKKILIFHASIAKSFPSFLARWEIRTIKRSIYYRTRLGNNLMNIIWKKFNINGKCHHNNY